MKGYGYVDRGFVHPGGVSPVKEDDEKEFFPDPTSKVSVKDQVKTETKEVKKKEDYTHHQQKEIQEATKEEEEIPHEEQKGESMNLGDKIDLALSAGGMAPVVGAFADGANVVQNVAQTIGNLAVGDYKEAKHDAENTLWAAAAFIPFGVGQWFTGMKYAKASAKVAKTERIGGKVTADFLNNATEAEIKNSRILSKYEKVEILNARVNTKIAAEAAKGGTVNGVKYYEGATHYGKIAQKDFRGVTKDIFAGVRQTGKVTDDALAKMNWNVATDLKPDHVKKIGNQGGRDIFEVSFPDGSKQKFWRSSGGGGKLVTLADGTKVSSKGFFGTVAGHMDAPPGVIGEPGSKAFKEGVDGWFVKGQEWQGYGSKTYKETGAALKGMFDNGLIK